jgi:hypothetical protein
MVAPDHIQWQTLDRTSLDKWSARRSGLHLYNTQRSQETNIHAPSGIRTCNPSKQAAEEPTPSETLPVHNSMKQDALSTLLLNLALRSKETRGPGQRTRGTSRNTRLFVCTTLLFHYYYYYYYYYYYLYKHNNFNNTLSLTRHISTSIGHLQLI